MRLVLDEIKAIKYLNYNVLKYLPKTNSCYKCIHFTCAVEVQYLKFALPSEVLMRFDKKYEVGTDVNHTVLLLLPDILDKSDYTTLLAHRHNAQVLRDLILFRLLEA